MLYIVGTSIGNIQDTAFRSGITLTKAEIILVEDTRTFDGYYKKIQTLFNVKPIVGQKILPHNKDNEYQQLPTVISCLEENKTVALVSESGMPLISDPGSLLLQHVIKEQIPYTVIPGPTAFTNALVLSGFSTNKVLFLGFLPKKKSQLLQLFNKLKCVQEFFDSFTIVFYESPYRINDTLSTIDEVFPTAQICICREMTKKFEQIIRGTAKELTNKTYKGEITVVLELNL